MAGQSEAADDLIAELAKLMAQDAQGERKAQSAAPSLNAAQVTPVRIPGDAPKSPTVHAPTEFVRSFSSSVAAPAKPDTGRDTFGLDKLPQRHQAPGLSEGNVAAGSPEMGFNFSHGRAPSSGLEDAPVETAAPSQAIDVADDDTAPEHQADQHDTIADLISAELAGDPEPAVGAMAPVAAAPTVRAEVSAASALMPTSVASAAGGQQREPLISGRADQDRFKVPPVFGLGSTAAKPVSQSTATPVEAKPTAPVMTQPKAPAVAAAPGEPVAKESVGLDPIDEIESLIGRAMRVEFDFPEEDAPAPTPEPEPTPLAPAPAIVTKPAPSPALRSLATPTTPAPRSADLDGLSAADQTIFAAAQATGAKVGWADTTELGEAGLAAETDVEDDAYQAAPRRRSGFGLGISRAVAGPLVAVTLLLAAGFGLYWVLGLGDRDAGPAPLLTADTTPVKETAPVVPVDEATETQSVVFNEMDGAAPAADEQLLSRDQADVAAVTEVATAEPDLNEEGLANRKVRTVKVRPDGTIVSGDDGVAGSAILPVDRPNVPVVPGAETATAELLASAQPVEPIAELTPQAVPFTPVQPGSTVPAVDLVGNLIAGKTAIVPRVRPIGLTLPVVTQVSADIVDASPAALDLALPGTTEVQAVGDTAPAYVQLASQRSEADARQSAQNMVTRYGPLFGGASLEVQRVDLGLKGIYYRVRVPASSIEQANMICTNVKAAGGDCFTL